MLYTKMSIKEIGVEGIWIDIIKEEEVVCKKTKHNSISSDYIISVEIINKAGI
jgi:hypothetical protein